MGAGNTTSEPPGMMGGDRAAHLVRVSAFKQILFLPLTLQHPANEGTKPSPGAMRKKIDCIYKRITHDQERAWKAVPDPLIGNSEDQTLKPEHYAEFIYFHGFIQRLIYGRDTDGGETFDMRVLE